MRGSTAATPWAATCSGSSYAWSQTESPIISVFVRVKRSAGLRPWQKPMSKAQ